jgi:hypothetical protein
MNNIKTYEAFKNGFKPKISKSIEEYKEEIDSFLDDLKDISIGSYIIKYLDDYIYLSAIRDYDSKKEEINIFLEEIKSVCKSIGVNVFDELNYYAELKYNNEVINFIVLKFSFNKLNYISDVYIDLLYWLSSKIGLNIGNIYF